MPASETAASAAAASTAPAGQETSTSTTTQHTPKRITNPRRLLILTPASHSNQTIPVLLHSLTGVLPAVTPQSSSTATTTTTTADNNEQEPISFAGYTTHAPLQITNKYYTAEVPIWVDEIPLSSPPSKEKEEKTTKAETETAAQWKESFLSSEAREVRDAIGAILVCVRNPRGLSRAIPREAYDDSNDEEINKDPEERRDVEVIKELVQIVSELKTKIEEERSGGDDEDPDIGLIQGAEVEVPGLLVLVDEHGSSSSLSPSKKDKGEGDEDDDDGLELQEPFTPPWWEDILYDMDIFGFEVISWTPPASTTASTTETETAETRNVYGELEGLPRIKEVLSTHEWGAPSSSSYSALTNGSDGEDYDGEDDDIMAFLTDSNIRGGRGDESDGFRREVNQLEREMMGLRFAINENSNGADDDDDDDDNENDTETGEIQVENLEALMMRMRAIKDISSDLPESKRKAFAAKAVRDIMREL